MPATLPDTFGRYRIVKKLGAGGMGTVYLAHDTEMDRPIALKVPQFDKREQQAVIEQFKREARVAAKIRHPGICPIYDVGQIDGVHYLTMAFIDGKELAEVLSAGEPWPPARAVELIIQLAEALHELHAHGIVHRDLKPGNILLQPNGQPVLLDFGLARSLVTLSEQMATKSAGQGTPAYMAPEQWEAKPELIKPWTDVYALGVILFELLTGQRPFKPASFVELFGQVMHAERPRPAQLVTGIPPALDQLCCAAMAIDPHQRPGDMRQFIARLAAPRNGIVVQCPNCAKRVRIPENREGKKVKCPGCRAPLPLDVPASPVLSSENKIATQPDPEVLDVPPVALVSPTLQTTTSSRQRTAIRPGASASQGEPLPGESVSQSAGASRRRSPRVWVFAGLGVALVGIAVGATVLAYLAQGTAEGPASAATEPAEPAPPSPVGEWNVTFKNALQMVLTFRDDQTLFATNGYEGVWNQTGRKITIKGIGIAPGEKPSTWEGEIAEDGQTMRFIEPSGRLCVCVRR